MMFHDPSFRDEQEGSSGRRGIYRHTDESYKGNL